MSQTFKSVSLVSIMLLSVMSGMVVATDYAEANTVVITEPQQIVDGGSASDTQTAIVGDSQGNVHIIWARNNLHLYYSMLASNGEVLIDATQITNPGIHKVWHPDAAVDEDDNIHIVWTDKSGVHRIMYSALSPYKIQPFNGQSSTDASITGIDDTEISKRSQDRDWPSIDIDSQGNVHIAWQDEYDELDKFFNQPQIYYSMIEPDFVTQDVITLFDDTLITPIIGHKGHPDIVVDANDQVQIAWDDTRGGKVELVFVIDTSGSMNEEWADVCTVIYGGTFSDNSPFEGIKPLLEVANMTVYETIYGIDGYGLPAAVDQGDCTGYNQNSGPRPTPLGDGDDSGGIRSLATTVYNGNPYSGDTGEDWGPGTNWACLSWKDANGNVPGSPLAGGPNHMWNPNATKIVLPISDEGPKDGDSAQQADDISSIDEAHESCVKAGVIPIGLYGDANQQVQSHFLDLAKCPNGVISTQARNCPGTDPANNPRNVNAGGQVYEFPSGSPGTGAMETLVEAMVYISTNNSREIYMTVLDPYAKMTNDPSWAPGKPGHSEANGGYVEDTGSAETGHLVVVNDTRVTIDDAYSFHPSIGVDMQGNTHIAWMDARDYGFEKSANYEVYYTKLRLQGAGAFDGAEEGLSTYAIKKIEDTAISNVEGLGGLTPSRPWSGHSIFPALLTDEQNNVHIAWVDSANVTAGEEIQYTRLNQTDLTGLGEFALDPWEIVSITSWASNKLGTDTGGRPEIGMPPAFANDLGSGAHVGWSDRNKCNDEQNGAFTICYSHVLTGQVDVELELGETFYHVIEPGEQTLYNLTMNNSTPGDIDLVADTYGLNVTGVPQNWTAQIFFSENQTQITPTTPIYLKGGEFINFYLRVQAPTIYQANEDELAQIVVTAKSYKDPAIRSDLTTLTLMDVVHGIILDTSLSVQDIEQGSQATFSITITNTGNVQDSFLFWDPNTLEGQQEWLLPFGWEITFPLRVELDPGKSTTKILTVKVPSTEDPGAFVIYLKGWSEGEPIKSVDKGTYDILELGIFVSIQSEGNIVFEELLADEREVEVMAGDCHTFEQDVTKNFESGNLIFSTPGAPEAQPGDIDEATWRQSNWVLDIDFSQTPGGADATLGEPIEWKLDAGTTFRTWMVRVNVCVPDDASIGSKSFTLQANLEGYQKVSDSGRYTVNVIHEYSLDSQIELEADRIVSVTDSNGNPISAIAVNPGENLVLPVTTMNNGNGPDRFDFRLTTVIDPTGIPVRTGHWDIVIPRESLEELDRDSDQTFDVLMNIPEFDIGAGLYVVEFKTLSEEAYPNEQNRITRERDVDFLYVYVNEFYDMEISMDPTVDNPVKVSAPGKIVSFAVNITNNGNVLDWPTLDNHTAQSQGNDLVWNELPGMGALSGWSVEWRTIKKISNDLSVDEECVVIKEAMPAADANQVEIDAYYSMVEQMQDANRCAYFESNDVYMAPKLAPYQTVEMIAVVKISTTAKLATRNVGLKVVSMAGDMTEGGDYDSSPSWQGEELDSNEFIVTLSLKAPDLVIKDIIVSEYSAEIDSTIPIGIILQNVGNTHATDIEIVLCQYDDVNSQSIVNDIKRNGCDEDSVVMRQVVGALLAPDASEDAKEIEIYLLYPVVAGSKGVYVVVDPMNEIVEGSESNNIMAVSEPLESPSPFFDVAGQVVGKTALPFIVIVLTLSLLGVVYFVGKARREEVKKRIAEQSSLVSVLESGD